MSTVQVTNEQLADMAAGAKTLCDRFNRLISSPGASLQLYQRQGVIDIAVQESAEDEEIDIPAVQRAFLSLSDRMKYDKLRFGSGIMGSIWADFSDGDEVEWRAALNPRKPNPPSTATFEILLYKL